jgi:formate-dependent nitrite reductase membrane component NrfD
VATDGRDFDSRIAEAAGEAAEQRATRPDERQEAIASQPWAQVPSVAGPNPTYYGRPMLKSSVWSADIPLYYFLGGAAGAALTLGAAIQFTSRGNSRTRELRQLSARCHWVGIIGSTAGAAFLIHDLGRPSRFAYMMRVFRPSSPMNIGAWILAGAAPSAIVTGLFINRPGTLGAIGEAAGYASGVFGAALAGYTGVLVANTVLPIWQDARRWMPVLFISSAAATAASVLDILYAGGAAGRITRLFGTVGRIAEIACAKRVEKLASKIPEVGKPFHQGLPARLWKGATIFTIASVVVSVIPRMSPGKKRLAGLLGVAGALLLRFAIHELGDASAHNPSAAFEQQRAAAQ